MVMLTIGLVLTVDGCVLTSAISCAPLNILPSSVTHEQLENVGDVSFFFFFNWGHFAISTPAPWEACSVLL